LNRERAPSWSRDKLTGKACERAREAARRTGQAAAVGRREKAEGLRRLFENRGGAGKGEVIKAIAERVSPRVFRAVGD